eukprot:6440-Heterococcus_DN1.PRE.1
MHVYQGQRVQRTNLVREQPQVVHVIVMGVFIHMIHLEISALAVLANGTMMCDVHHLADVPLEVCALAIDLALPVGLQMARLAADDVDEAVAAHFAHKANAITVHCEAHMATLSTRATMRAQ